MTSISCENFNDFMRKPGSESPASKRLLSSGPLESKRPPGSVMNNFSSKPLASARPPGSETRATMAQMEPVVTAKKVSTS